MECCKGVFTLPITDKIRDDDFGKSEKLKLTGFSDSDWAGNIDNRISTSGFCFKLNNSSGAIKLQKCVSTSTAEAELKP